MTEGFEFEFDHESSYLDPFLFININSGLNHSFDNYRNIYRQK